MSEDWEERWGRGARTFYIAEIVRQATYALTALDQALEIAKADNASNAWPSIQTFLTAFANVSKLLWPVRPDDNTDKAPWRKFRGERLRTELEVSDSSVLHDRDVRNSADHFDERIDDLVRDQPIPQSWSEVQDESFVRLRTPFRAVDLKSGMIIAGHDSTAYGPVADELKLLLARCAELEPRAIGTFDVVALMATLRWPPLPSIFAPSERPDEPVTASVEVDRTGPQTLEELIAMVAKRFRAEQQQAAEGSPGGKPGATEAP